MNRDKMRKMFTWPTFHLHKGQLVEDTGARCVVLKNGKETTPPKFATPAEANAWLEANNIPGDVV